MLSTRLFSSVPVPRSCFGGLFLKCLLKTPCRQRALIGDIFNSETEPNGKLFFHSGYAVTYLPKNNPHTHIRQFFLSTKRMDSFGRNGSSGVRTQDWPVMSRLLWPTELSFLSSKKIQGRCDICLFTTVAVLDHQPQQRLKPPGTFDCSFSHRRCDRWLKGISLKKRKKKIQSAPRKRYKLDAERRMWDSNPRMPESKSGALPLRQCAMLRQSLNPAARDILQKHHCYIYAYPGTPVSVVTHLEEIWFWISISLL